MGEEALDGLHARHWPGRPYQRRELILMGGDARERRASSCCWIARCSPTSSLGFTRPSKIRRRQPDRDAADCGCAVERQRPELTQNHRGRLQADTVAVIDRE